MKTVKNSKYLWCKSRKNYNDNLKNLTIDISDDEYQELQQYGLQNINNEPDPQPDPNPEPSPGYDQSKDYLTFNAITSGELIIDTNNKQYIPNIFINGIKKYYDSNSYYYNSSNIFKWDINIGDKITINYKSISAQNHKNCYPDLNFKYNLTGNIITIVESFYNNIQNFDKFDLNKIYVWELYIKDFDLNCTNINVFIPETLKFNIKDYKDYSDYL